MCAMDIGGNLLRQKQVCDENALDQAVADLEKQGGSLIPEPALWLEGLSGGAKVVRWSGMLSGCLNVSGGALVAGAGLVHSILAYNLAHNDPVGRFDRPMRDEISAIVLQAIATSDSAE